MKFRFVLAAGVFLLVAGSIFLLREKTGCHHLDCLTFVDSGSFKLKDVYAENRESYRAIYFNGNTWLRIEEVSVADQDTARQMALERETRVEGVFSKAISPYPGEITDTIECEPEFRPSFSTKQLERGWLTSTPLLFNDRRTMGICTREQAHYRGLLAYMYCGEPKKFYQLEFGFPIEAYAVEIIKHVQESLECL